MNSKQYCDFQVMFTEIQTKSKDFAQNQNGWFFNDSSKIVKKFSQMQNLGQLGPENCRAYVFFAWCVFCFVLFCFFCFPFFFFSFFFPLFSFFFLLIAWSKFALTFHIARFQFQKCKIFSFWEGISPSDTPCVSKHASGADAPPTHPPMSKTDVQPSVVLVN